MLVMLEAFFGQRRTADVTIAVTDREIFRRRPETSGRLDSRSIADHRTSTEMSLLSDGNSKKAEL